MVEKKYLTEENYVKGKKILIRSAIVVLVLSILIGGGLIVGALVKTDLSKKDAIRINEERRENAQKIADEKATKANERLGQIKVEIDKLEKERALKSSECNSLNMKDPDWFVKVNKCNDEKSKISSKINDLDLEKFELENANYTVYYDKVTPKKYYVLIVFGIGILLFGGMISLILFITAKRREITAFSVQQVMPVAQEGIDAMAPTVGNAAKEIARGIKEGLSDEEKK